MRKQYTGKTTDRFRYRRNNYKIEARKAENGNMENVKQKFLQSHFLQDDHKGFLEEVEVRLIDKTQGSDPTKPECVPSDLLLLGNFLEVCSWFMVQPAASKCSFIYLAMQVDWKCILVASLSVAGLHAFGVAP